MAFFSMKLGTGSGLLEGKTTQRAEACRTSLQDVKGVQGVKGGGAGWVYGHTRQMGWEDPSPPRAGIRRW